MQFRIAITFLMIVLCGLKLSAQSTNLLSDNNLSSAAGWQQDIAFFIDSQDGYIIDTANSAGSYCLFQNLDGYYPEQGDTEWQVSIQSKIANNTKNRFDLILIANGKNINDPDFVGYGIASGLPKTIELLCLVKYSNGTAQCLYSSQIAIKGSASKPQIQDVDIKRTKDGKWFINGKEVYADGDIFCPADYIVARVEHNASNKKNLGFKISKFSQDITSVDAVSRIDSVTLTSKHSARLFFSGRLSGSIDSKCITIGGKPAKSVSPTSNYIDIESQEIFADKQEIVASGIKDLWGHEIPVFRHEIQVLAPHQIVINEIMADVEPCPLSLPDSRYIELYNNSGNSISLNGFRLVVGKREFQMPGNAAIKPSDYLIISHDERLAAFGNFVLADFKNELSVSGKYIALVDNFGSVVDSLTYSDKMYKDTKKKEGGYSLERIDPQNTCSQSSNWLASKNINGGTPGSMNSVYSTNEDLSKPELSSFMVTGSSTIELTFSKPMQSMNLSMNGGKPLPYSVESQKVELGLTARYDVGSNTIAGSVTDFCGNTNDIAFEIEYEPLSLTKAVITGRNELTLEFNAEIIDPEPGNFIVSGQQPLRVDHSPSTSKMLLLSMSNEFEDGQDYTVKARNLKSIFGDVMKEASAEFSCRIPKPGDIVINELMFQPDINCKKFVELYNASGEDLLIDMIWLEFHSTDTAGHTSSPIVAKEDYTTFAADDYWLLTSDPELIRSNYKTGGQFFKSPKSLPMNDSCGIVVLKHSGGITLDSVCYNKGMHSIFADTTLGLSLERNDPYAPSNKKDNWHSALGSSGYASPGLPNSYKTSVETSIDDTKYITVENQLMHPGDGEKMYTLTFNFKHPETYITVEIFDIDGRVVTALSAALSMGHGTSLSWDGRDKYGAYCPTGIYVVIITAYDTSGYLKEFKKTCVINRH